jgi:hypothetical protein
LPPHASNSISSPPSPCTEQDKTLDVIAQSASRTKEIAIKIGVLMQRNGFNANLISWSYVILTSVCGSQIIFAELVFFFFSILRYIFFSFFPFSGDELDNHNEMIGEISTRVDRAKSKLSRGTDKLKLILTKTKSNSFCCELTLLDFSPGCGGM